MDTHRNWTRYIATILFVLVSSLSPLIWSSVGASTEIAPSEVERIDAFVTQQMRKHRLPGLALALVEGDQIVFMKGYGKADETGRPVTPQTPFLLASVSKPITAVATMQLVESGKIELDTSIQHYLPEFRVADPIASNKITVRHLLLHTSGLPTTACDTRRNAQSLADYVAELRTVELISPVGTRHVYCSGNYNILGRMIEVVSGQSFGEYVQEHIFAPLEMQNSFTSEEKAQKAGLAQGYQWFFGLPIPTHYPYNPSQLPSGYLISSAEDMSHFLISQLNGGSYAGANILSAENVHVMQTPGTQRGKDGGYGFGWVIASFGNVPSVRHDGVNANYHSLLWMQPEAQRGAVLLMNSFGIVAYESGYKEIEEGVARMLAGLESVESTRSVGTVYVLVDLVLAAALILVLVPLVRMKSGYGWLAQRLKVRNQPGMRVYLRVAGEIGFALVVLTGVRLFIVTGMGAQSWYEFFTVFPDFVLWIWAFAMVVFSTGVLRAALVWRERWEPKDNSVQDNFKQTLREIR